MLKMPETFYQTVDVYFPFSAERFSSMELAPVIPDFAKCEFHNGKDISIKRKDGTVITWKTDYIVGLKDGIMKFWWNKPTLEQALESFPLTKGHFYQFNKNGSVNSKQNNKTYYWSSPIFGNEEKADFASVYDETTGDTVILYNEPQNIMLLNYPD